MGDVRVQSSSSAIRPVAVGMDQDRKRRNEIFVDLLEHHDVTTTAEVTHLLCFSVPFNGSMTMN